MLMEKAKNPEFWQSVRNDPACLPLITEVKKDYQASYSETISCLSYRVRMRFYKDGDRHEFEKPYFQRRTNLASAALLALIYPEEPSWVERIQEIIWAICEEYSWALPAHVDGCLEDDLTRIDLFAAETGFTLAEIVTLLENRLDKLVLDRVRAEIQTRIVENYQNGHFWWETGDTNWAAVCAGNVGGTLLYMAPDVFWQQMPRLLDTMKCFLTGFPEDGTCMEGSSYWQYGFGNYVWFADLLNQATDGKTDLFQWDKIREISGYANRSFLCGGTMVSYSDGSRTGKTDRAMNHYLARRFPEQVSVLPDSMTGFGKGNVYWMQGLRNFLYIDFHAVAPEKKLENYDLPGAQQVIINDARYSLAVKAGHNEEPHNHNDVGNFILATDRGQIFCDLGAGLYNRQYFSSERYSIFCNSSLGHNVPILNGQEQKSGREYAGSIHHTGNVITVEMAAAYGQPQVTELTRVFTYDSETVAVTDTVDPSCDLTERFVTTFQPELFENRVEVNGVSLVFDPAVVKLQVKEEQHLLHNYESGTETVYCLDFHRYVPVESVTLTMKIDEE